CARGSVVSAIRAEGVRFDVW
nr:immunoglobulin heavy chain junction region [Macaca mulatta]